MIVTGVVYLPLLLCPSFILLVPVTQLPIASTATCAALCLMQHISCDTCIYCMQHKCFPQDLQLVSCARVSVLCVFSTCIRDRMQILFALQVICRPK